MNDSDTRRLEMFMRVDQFGTTEAARFPAGTFANELFANLRQIISDLEAQAGAQESGRGSARQGGQSKAVAREELRQTLEAISRTARAMSATMPGLEDKFRAPRSVSDQQLLAIARSFAAEALLVKAEFIKRGLASTFIEDLNADIAAFEEAMTQRIQGTQEHIAATASIDDLVDRGMSTVRELDAIMRNTFAGNPAKLAAWLSASHVERNPQRNTPTAPAPAPPAS